MQEVSRCSPLYCKLHKRPPARSHELDVVVYSIFPLVYARSHWPAPLSPFGPFTLSFSSVLAALDVKTFYRSITGYYEVTSSFEFCADGVGTAFSSLRSASFLSDFPEDRPIVAHTPPRGGPEQTAELFSLFPVDELIEAQSPPKTESRVERCECDYRNHYHWPLQDHEDHFIVCQCSAETRLELCHSIAASNEDEEGGNADTYFGETKSAEVCVKSPKVDQHTKQEALE